VLLNFGYNRRDGDSHRYSVRIESFRLSELKFRLRRFVQAHSAMLCRAMATAFAGSGEGPRTDTTVMQGEGQRKNECVLRRVTEP
jgi:hypothetical protein